MVHWLSRISMVRATLGYRSAGYSLPRECEHADTHKAQNLSGEDTSSRNPELVPPLYSCFSYSAVFMELARIY